MTIGASSPLAPWAVITRTSPRAAVHLALDRDVEAGEGGGQALQVAHARALGGQRLGQELVEGVLGLGAQAGQQRAAHRAALRRRRGPAARA